MKPLVQLGQKLARRWKALGEDEARFPALAAEALAAARLPERWSPFDALRWVTTTTELPRQINPAFGQPPLTVYATDKFFVDLYFWTDGDTSIHGHGFCGAFQVVQGSCVHSRHGFALRRRANSRLLLGDVTFVDAELLAEGDVRPIIRDSVHSLVRIGRPSVTLVIRTYHDTEAGPQYTYAPPHVAYDQLFEPALLGKQKQILSMLARLGHRDLEERAREALRGADLFGTFQLLQLLFEACPAALYHRLEDSSLGVHGDDVKLLRPSFERSRRLVRLARIRRGAVDPMQHLVLALLTQLPSREAVFLLLRGRFPRTPPREVVLRVVEELAAIPTDDCPAGNALGLRLDEGLVAVLAGCLDGSSPEEIVKAHWPGLAGARKRARQRLVQAAVEALQGVDLFRPLLGPPTPAAR